MMIDGISIARSARRLIGVPERARGRSLEGVDCVGFVWLAIKDATGIEICIPAYPDKPSASDVFSNVYKFATRIRNDETQDGDLALMEWGGQSTHFGILSGDSMVYVSSMRKQVVAMPAKRVMPRVVAFFRLRDGGSSSRSS